MRVFYFPSDGLSLGFPLDAIFHLEDPDRPIRGDLWPVFTAHPQWLLSMVGVQEGYLDKDEGHTQGKKQFVWGARRVCYGKGLLGKALWMERRVICYSLPSMVAVNGVCCGRLSEQRWGTHEGEAVCMGCKNRYGVERGC